MGDGDKSFTLSDFWEYFLKYFYKIHKNDRFLTNFSRDQKLLIKIFYE